MTGVFCRYMFKIQPTLKRVAAPAPVVASSATTRHLVARGGKWRHVAIMVTKITASGGTCQLAELPVTK
jgi:hypothetical protein